MTIKRCSTESFKNRSGIDVCPTCDEIVLFKLDKETYKTSFESIPRISREKNKEVHKMKVRITQIQKGTDVQWPPKIYLSDRQLNLALCGMLGFRLEEERKQGEWTKVEE